MNPKVDFIFNGQGFGDVADRLLEANMDTTILRPWRSSNGKSYVTRADGRTYLSNTPASLPFETWTRIDARIQQIQRQTLRVWNDLNGAGLGLDLPNGMGTPILTEQTMGDSDEAIISMDPLKNSEDDALEFDTKRYPIPIIHGGFRLTARQIANYRRTGTPVDTIRIGNITRRIAEKVEGLVLGTVATYRYGGGYVYGLTNHPQAQSTTLTNPTSVGWTPETTYNEILGMLTDLQDANYNGPYGMYFSPAWTQFLAQDYNPNYPNVTLNTKLRDLADLDLRWARKLTYGLTGYKIIIFQLTEDVIQALNGLDLQTLQWDSAGGLAKHFKIMCIYLPKINTNAEGDATGINYGVAA